MHGIPARLFFPVPRYPVPAFFLHPQGCCYGCGAKLQIEVPMGPGYVKAEKYEVKKAHRQLDKVWERLGRLMYQSLPP